MNSIPRSTRSSLSPNPNSRGQYEYPSPVQHDVGLNSRKITSNQGLGGYSCGIHDSPSNYEDSMLPLPSSSSASNWHATALLPERPSQPSPNILSADYDPFASFHSDLTTSYTSTQHQHLYPTRSTEASIPPTSPSLSGVGSQRSSFSSAPASETYSHSESYQNFQTRIKMEEHLEWPLENNNALMLASSQADNPALASSASSYPGCLEAAFFTQSETIGWPKVEALGAPDFPESSGRASVSVSGGHQAAEARKMLGNGVTRTRNPRKMTTREEANFQCKVKGCGKLFSRSYNFKAHMETHDAGRVYPFPCPLSGCNKRFVRKTDLQRHHQSVHMKERNYQCDFCNRHFARKDTLRRHMEDGCPKRFDLAVAFNPQHPQDRDNERVKTSAAEGRPPHSLSQYSSSSMPYSQTSPRPSSNLQVDFLGHDSAWPS